MQVQYYSEIQPSFARPNISDVTGPFLVWFIRCEVTIQQVWRNVELMIAVRCRLVCARSNHGYAVLTHQPAHAAVADIQANFFQLFCYPWPAIAAQTETRLFLDLRKRNQIRSLPPASWTTAELAQTTRADVHHMAHPTNGECR